MSELGSNSSDLLRRCKETIEVSHKQQLQSEVALYKNSKKETEQKTKILEDQILQERKRFEEAKGFIEELRVANEAITQDLSRFKELEGKSDRLAQEVLRAVKEKVAVEDELQRVRYQLRQIERGEQKEGVDRQELIRINEELQRVKEENQKIRKEFENNAEELRNVSGNNEELRRAVESKEVEIEKLVSDVRRLEKEVESRAEAFEGNRKKLVAGIKQDLKQKFREKEEKLKSEINLSIEEIQKTIRMNSVEHLKLKKENSELQKALSVFQGKANLYTKEGVDFEGLVKVNEFLKQKIEITESSLKSEIEKNNKLAKDLENEQLLFKAEKSQFAKKISEKNSKLNTLTKQLSELENKSAEIFNEFIEKEANFRKKSTQIKAKNKENKEKLLKAIGELQEIIQQKEIENSKLQSTLKATQSSLDQAVSDKRALENSINDLEVSIKHLNIQQARQSLEELATVKQKLAQETLNKSEIQEKILSLQSECEFIQKKILQDSHFFKVEHARKDQEILKLNHFYDSKLKQKEAEYAVKLEEIRTDLSGVLEELLNNEAPDECCSVLEQMIESLGC